MERIIHRLLLAWVLLLSAALLTPRLPLLAGTRLGYWAMLAVVFTTPVVLLLLCLEVGLGLRAALHRLRVLRRAARRKRKEPRAPWPGEEWDA